MAQKSHLKIYGPIIRKNNRWTRELIKIEEICGDPYRKAKRVAKEFENKGLSYEIRESRKTQVPKSSPLSKKRILVEN